jgi:MerR family mercuric resistance operon transcriptional regulator
MLLTIAGLAREGGVGVETVRYYQRRGLLPTPVQSGGIRRYDRDDVRRLRFIRSGQSAGFTLDEIATLLALDSTDDRAQARSMAVARIAALDAAIADLKRARSSLAKLAKECGSGSAGPCPILEAFEDA